jgi:hypothetical protein
VSPTWWSSAIATRGWHGSFQSGWRNPVTMRAERLRFGRRSTRCDDSRLFTRSPTCGSTDYPSYDLEPAPVDFAARYDRVPKGEVEIRRASAVESADGHHLGDVDGFLVDDSQLITHVVLEQGHPWERREVLIPIGAVSRVESDQVTLSLTKDEVGALPPVAIRRWPRPLEHRSPRR